MKDLMFLASLFLVGCILIGFGFAAMAWDRRVELAQRKLLTDTWMKKQYRTVAAFWGFAYGAICIVVSIASLISFLRGAR